MKVHTFPYGTDEQFLLGAVSVLLAMRKGAREVLQMRVLGKVGEARLEVRLFAGAGEGDARDLLLVLKACALEGNSFEIGLVNLENSELVRRPGQEKCKGFALQFERTLDLAWPETTIRVRSENLGISWQGLINYKGAICAPRRAVMAKLVEKFREAGVPEDEIRKLEIAYRIASAG